MSSSTNGQKRQRVLVRPVFMDTHVKQHREWSINTPAVGMYCYLFTSENDCKLTVRAPYCSGAATNAAQ